MAKPKHVNKRKKAQAAARKEAPKEPTRRRVLAMAPYIAGGAIVLGGAGFWGVSSVRADLAEQDLSVIGSGIPTVVQVHDPTCPVCQTLQREARAALADLDDGEIAYRVASIKNDVGSAFATLHGSGHATLLLFDRAGTLTRRITAPADRDALYSAFTAHIARGS